MRTASLTFIGSTSILTTRACKACLPFSDLWFYNGSWRSL
jgi:hypothetical protein